MTRLLVVAQLARGAALAALLTTHDFLPLMLYSALGALPDRASSVLTKLFAARVAGPRRVRYQAIQRTAVNIGWAVGGAAPRPSSPSAPPPPTRYCSSATSRPTSPSPRSPSPAPNPPRPAWS
ncbi:hypothetical protein ACFQ60_06770 [Streptomyces zhihengii]